MALNEPPSGLNISLQILKMLINVKFVWRIKITKEMQNLQVLKKEGKVSLIAQVVWKTIYWKEILIEIMTNLSIMWARAALAI